MGRITNLNARALLSDLIPEIFVVNFGHGALAFYFYLDIVEGTLWRLHTRIVDAFNQLAATADSYRFPFFLHVRQLSFLEVIWLGSRNLKSQDLEVFSDLCSGFLWLPR